MVGSIYSLIETLYKTTSVFGQSLVEYAESFNTVFSVVFTPFGILSIITLGILVKAVGSII